MQPTKGHGWKLSNNTGLKRNQTYVVTFRDEESRKKLKPYVKIGLDQLNAMPEMKSAHIRFNIANKNHYVPLPGKDNYQARPGTYTFVYGLKSWPKGDWSSSTMGGVVWINEGYWYKTGKLHAHDYAVKNIVTHELGHLLGLDHCDKEAGLNPLMCELGDPRTFERQGLFREPDLNGIRYLIINARMGVQ
ncbi:matrixin family metalloprotease [Streptomyces olivochromogenes]|uniref:matrixin family metalloprotease n=1 Tax=Streptomyces olivochromogenes TaxID=1963 RepID=UPI00131D4222|nr:matrixin family metalloprotease [Streptomyces olivochromogenes]